MKYKEFKIKIGDNPALSQAVQRHAFGLGYKWSQSNGVSCTHAAYLYFYCGGSILWNDCANDFYQDTKEHISIRDFFKLTTDDVIEEPEMFHCDFNVLDKLQGYGAILSQDQIDRIKAIMQEGES